MIPETLVTQSESETRAWGSELAEKLKPGDCFLLTGELGAGKTTLVKGIAAGLGIDPEAVTSPTFVLIHEHQGRLPLYHIDAYRIEKSEELVEVGLESYLSGDGVTIIEWGERVAQLAPSAIRIGIELLDETRRRITLDRTNVRAAS